jgi:ABC-type multidrug transport system ATPase subunit
MSGKTGNTLITARDISVHRGSTEVVHPLDINVTTGLTVLKGASGAGKSNLVDALHGLYPISTGTIRHELPGAPTFDIAPDERSLVVRAFQGVVIETRAERRAKEYRSRHLGLIVATPRVPPVQTANEYIAGTHKIRHNTLDPEFLGYLFEGLGIADKVDRPMETLSEGEAQRALIAYALAHKPAYVTADEPTSKLDTVTAGHTLDLFKEIADQTDISMLVVSHSDQIAEAADRVITMQDGRVIADTSA